MKISETKIYLKFIGWFIFVSLFPIIILFIAASLVDSEINLFADPEVRRLALFGFLISLAFVFILSLIATRFLSREITGSVRLSVSELSKVVETLVKSVGNLSDISSQYEGLAAYLMETSKEQQSGLRTGHHAVKDMNSSIREISKKTDSAAKDVGNINKLIEESGQRANTALDSLVTVKHMANENQKLGQALDDYTHKVNEAAKQVEVLADTAKFLSLNVSIEANKKSFPAEFSGLISQIRELNVTSHQVANTIQNLAKDMRRQIEQSKQSSVYEWEETNKSIGIVGETIKFMQKIVSKVSNITQSVEIINKESGQTFAQADGIDNMIKDLNEKAKNLVKKTSEINSIVQQQIIVSKSLDKSSTTLNSVTKNLNDLVENDAR